MFKDDYRRELDNISASDKFKQDTISLMNEKQAELQQNEAKTIKFRPKHYGRIAASVAVLVLALGAYAYSQSDFAIGPDNAGAEKAVADQEIYESIHPGYDKKYRLTIDDRKPLEKAATPRVQNDSCRISMNMFNHGMGYEAHMVYGPYELEFNPEYELGDEFDTLPVYKFVPLAPNEALDEVNSVITALNAEASDIKFTWSKPIYREDGTHFSSEEIKTETAVSPGEQFTLNYIDGNFVTDSDITGNFSLWATRGQIRLNIDEPVSETKKPADVFAGVMEKYPLLFDNENIQFFSWYDYMFSAIKNYSNKIYSKTDDRRQNIFNATMYSASVSVHEKSEDEPVLDQSIIWLPLPYYQKAENLPAITYQQALGLLFNGQFYSSKTDTIPQDAVISHTELVYYPPEYKMTIPGYEGYSLPFYKFYIEDPEQQRETLGGILKEYYVCYVCALDPACVDLTGDYGVENIVQFNGAPVN